MASASAVAEPEAEALPREEAEAMSITVTPGRARVLAGVRSTVRALVSLRAPELEACGPGAEAAPPRAPLQVACVLDCSGSMAGQPLDFAKRAVMKLVKHLGEQDTLHFLTYSSQAQVVFQDGDLSEAGKESLRAHILGVRASGGTNLFSGLEAAVALLAGGQSEAADERGVRRVFLFSDGCVNQGVTDSQRIHREVANWAREGVTTSTFGIGTAFDEPLMRGIAEAGKGRYTYLATAADIPKLVSKSLHGLLDLYASEAVLDVRGAAHTALGRLYGCDEQEGTDGMGSPGLLALGDLHHGSERRVLLELEVAPPGGSGADACAFTAAEWTLSLQRRGALAQFSGRIELRATDCRGELGTENTAVQVAFAIQRAADLDLEVSQHLARGDRLSARGAKQRQVALLKEALEAARSGDGSPTDVETLARVLERAERVAVQFDDGESTERIRLQSLQEMVLNRCMSEADWASGCDSDEAADVANLSDFEGSGTPARPRARASPRSRPCFRMLARVCGGQIAPGGRRGIAAPTGSRRQQASCTLS